jgi:outer membrane protein TolC
VLETQRSLLSTQEQLVRCEATVVANLARLYKALGGGWSRTEAEKTDPSGAPR